MAVGGMFPDGTDGGGTMLAAVGSYLFCSPGIPVMSIVRCVVSELDGRQP